MLNLAGAAPVGVGWEYADDRTNDAQPRDRSVDRAVARLFAARARQDAVKLNRAGDYRTPLADAGRRGADRRLRGSDAELRALVAELRVEEQRWAAPMPEATRKRRTPRRATRSATARRRSRQPVVARAAAAVRDDVLAAHEWAPNEFRPGGIKRPGDPSLAHPTACASNPIAVALRAGQPRAAARGIAITDPVYEGKTMAGLIDLVSRGEIERSSNVLYAQLGGQPAIDGYASLFASGLRINARTWRSRKRQLGLGTQQLIGYLGFIPGMNAGMA